MDIYKKIANYITNNPDYSNCEIEDNERIAVIEFRSYVSSEQTHTMELNGFSQDFTESGYSFDITDAYWQYEDRIVNFTDEEIDKLQNLL